MSQKSDQPLEQPDNTSSLTENELDAALRAILYRDDCPDKMVLGDYRLGFLAEAEQEAIRRHLDRCPSCREALDRFEQFLLLDEALGAKEPATQAEVDLDPQPDWREILFDSGRAWLEPATGRWRQFTAALSKLSRQAGETPALAGLMSEASEADPAAQESLTIAPTGADFELEIMVTPDPAGDEAGLCQLEVALTLLDRFGDFSGAQVTLLWGDQARTEVTNTLGEVTFRRLPCDQVTTMSLLVRLPETP